MDALFKKMNNLKVLPSLLIFARVAKEQSFTEAAKQLGMSKSAVSQQVKRLENHIGQQLLSRHTRGMSLTTTGRQLLNRCELLQDQVELVLQAVDSSKNTPSGVFAITTPHSCEKDIVIPALNQLCLEFPDIEPRLLVSDEMQDLIKNKLDVALSFGELKDSQYRALPVSTVQEILCASSLYMQKNGPINNLADLEKQRWIPAPWQRAGVAVYERGDNPKKHELKVKFAASTNTMPTTVEMVSHGMGMALLPLFVVQTQLATGQYRHILPEYSGRQWPVYMVHRFQNDKPVHVTRFYELLKHFFAKAGH